MASLVEELLNEMNAETQVYEELLALTEGKRQTIVKNDIAELDVITGTEEQLSSRLKALENKRKAVLKDMAVVLGLDGQELSVTAVINKLGAQPEQQKALTEAKEALVKVAAQLRFENEQTQILLNQALEMVEFDLNVIKSMRQAPETANYNRNAYNTGEVLGGASFDTSQ